MEFGKRYSISGNRVIRQGESDWDDRCRILCLSNGTSTRDNDIDLQLDELSRDFGEALAAATCPAHLDWVGAALDPIESRRRFDGDDHRVLDVDTPHIPVWEKAKRMMKTFSRSSAAVAWPPLDPDAGTNQPSKEPTRSVGPDNCSA